MQRPLFLPYTPDLVGLAHEDCVQLLLSPDHFCGQTSLVVPFYTLPVSMFPIDTIFGIIKAFVGYFMVSLLLE